MNIGDTIYICSNDFQAVFSTSLMSSDTCMIVVEKRLEAFLQTKGYTFRNFRLVGKTFNTVIPKKHSKKQIIDF